MVVPAHSIFEAAFNSYDTKDLNLSFLIGTDRLSYLVLDPSASEVLGLKSYSFDAKTPLLPQLNELWAQDNFLSSSFAQQQLCLHTRRFTLLPSELYQEADKQVYLENVLPLSAQDVVLADDVAPLQAKLLYAVGSDFYDWMQQHFVNSKPYCVSTALINTELQMSADGDYRVLALLQARTLSVTVTRKAQLIMHQVYHFQSAEDCLYYILLTYKELGFSPEKQPLWLAGELLVQSEIYKLLYSYIRNIDFAARPSCLKYGEALRQLPAHFYYDLFSSKLCALSAER